MTTPTRDVLKAAAIAFALSGTACGSSEPAPTAVITTAAAPTDGAPRYSPWPGMPAESIATDAYGSFKKTPNAPHVGEAAPAFQTTLTDGSRYDLAQADQPTVVVFYRGFW